MPHCPHTEVHCLNQYELIRKYRCVSCNSVMMCACDKERGTMFLPHQLQEGTELETQRRIPVDEGFVAEICRECRGLPAEAHPVTEIPHRTSKIRRYYWREIAFREFELLAKWAEETGASPDDPFCPQVQEKREAVAKQALADIKRLHAEAPKYVYSELTQAEVIQRYQVTVTNLHAEHVKPRKGDQVRLKQGDQLVTPEEFVSQHFRSLGYEVLKTESVPFHVLFGLYMHLVVQGCGDPEQQLVVFGRRSTLGEVWTHLPDDFGSPGYGRRRAEAIHEHIVRSKMHCREELEWLFDYWLEPSSSLRDYLWAHEPRDVATARRVIEILPPVVICEILEYLAGDYWRRYCGWPDLIVWRGSEFRFVEVKSSRDKLSEDQKQWIKGNAEVLHLPFELAKIHNRR